MLPPGEDFINMREGSAEACGVLEAGAFEELGEEEVAAAAEGEGVFEDGAGAAWAGVRE